MNKLEIAKAILEAVFKIKQNNEGYFDLTYEFNTDGVLHVKVYTDIPRHFSHYFERDIDDNFSLEDFIEEVNDFIG